MGNRPELRERYKMAQQKYPDDNTHRLIGRRIIRAIMWDKSNGQCWYCGETTNPFTEFSIDLLIPQSRGGGDDFDNLVPCCQRCNRMKGGGQLESFRRNLALKISSVPIFDEAQRDYLRAKGVVEDIQTPEDFEFWYEKRENKEQKHEHQGNVTGMER